MFCLPNFLGPAPIVYFSHSWDFHKLSLLRRHQLEAAKALYLKLIQKISWKNIWLLSVWQKFIPLILLKFSSSVILILFGTINILVRRLSSVKQKKIKKILKLYVKAPKKQITVKRTLRWN